MEESSIMKNRNLKYSNLRYMNGGYYITVDGNSVRVNYSIPSHR